MFCASRLVNRFLTIAAILVLAGRTGALSIEMILPAAAEAQFSGDLLLSARTHSQSGIFILKVGSFYQAPLFILALISIFVYRLSSFE